MADSYVEGGVLIAIEGIDGAGKTTLAQALANELGTLGLTVVVSKEPTTGRHGQVLRASASTGRLSPSDELALFLADRTEHVENLIQPTLEAGRTMILDRYYFSNMAYQGAVGLDPEDIREANERIAPTPDLLIVLDVPVECGLERIRHRGDVANAFEQLDSLRRAREIFLSMKSIGARIIDAAQPAGAVLQQALNLVTAVIANKVSARVDLTGPDSMEQAVRGVNEMRRAFGAATR